MLSGYCRERKAATKTSCTVHGHVQWYKILIAWLHLDDWERELLWILFLLYSVKLINMYIRNISSEHTCTYRGDQSKSIVAMHVLNCVTVHRGKVLQYWHHCKMLCCLTLLVTNINIIKLVLPVMQMHSQP